MRYRDIISLNSVDLEFEMDGHVNEYTSIGNTDNMSKKEIKKYFKRLFGSIKGDHPKPSKNMYMAKSGWVSI